MTELEISDEYFRAKAELDAANDAVARARARYRAAVRQVNEDFDRRIRESEARMAERK